jgi:hypothetical protein
MSASVQVYQDIDDKDEEVPVEMATRIGAAVRFLQHEARASGLAELAAALGAAERVAIGSLSAPGGDTPGTSSIGRLCEILSLAGTDAEQAFRLRALAELSAAMSFDQLMRLAYLAECNPPHLGSLITMLSEDVEALARG